MVRLVLLALLFTVSAPVGAQTSGCLRGVSGALECGIQRSAPAPGTTAPIRPIRRPDLSAEAVKRSSHIAEQHRDALARQVGETNVQRRTIRQQCRDRAAASGDPAAACPR